jgi:uncharacterized protein (DUF2249 family)
MTMTTNLRAEDILESLTRVINPGIVYSIELVNDHDPKPLYYQFMAERQGQVGWEYLEEGPEVWRVRISKSDA